MNCTLFADDAHVCLAREIALPRCKQAAKHLPSELIIFVFLLIACQLTLTDVGTYAYSCASKVWVNAMIKLYLALHSKHHILHHSFKNGSVRQPASEIRNAHYPETFDALVRNSISTFRQLQESLQQMVNLFNTNV